MNTFEFFARQAPEYGHVYDEFGYSSRCPEWYYPEKPSASTKTLLGLSAATVVWFMINFLIAIPANDGASWDWFDYTWAGALPFVIYLVIDVVMFMTSAYGTLTVMQRVVVEEFKKLEPESQQEMGGLKHFIESIRSVEDEAEAEKIRVAIRMTLDSQKKERALVSKIKSPAPHIMEQVNAIKMRHDEVVKKLRELS